MKNYLTINAEQCQQMPLIMGLYFVLAVITNVIHSNKHSDQFPILFEVQALWVKQHRGNKKINTYRETFNTEHINNFCNNFAHC